MATSGIACPECKVDSHTGEPLGQYILEHTLCPVCRANELSLKLGDAEERALRLSEDNDEWKRSREDWKRRASTAESRLDHYAKALREIADHCGTDYYLENVGDMAREALKDAAVESQKE